MSGVYKRQHFFFFKQKTAYEIGVRLVGSEMCIRDSCSRVGKITGSLTADERNKWHSEVSFVGGMYHRNSYDEIKDRLPEYLRGYFDAAMAAQMEIYGDSIFDKVLTVDILEKLCELIDFKQDERAFSDIALVFSSTFLGFKLANIERVQILNKLAKHFPTDLYTDDPDKELIGVNLKGAVNYMTDMPKVFNCSRININPVMRNIRTGTVSYTHLTLPTKRIV